jgi:hypothetical protein
MPLIKIILLGTSRTWESNLAENHKHIDRNCHPTIRLRNHNCVGKRSCSLIRLSLVFGHTRVYSSLAKPYGYDTELAHTSQWHIF